jgi:hypothetical protein
MAKTSPSIDGNNYKEAPVELHQRLFEALILRLIFTAQKWSSQESMACMLSFALAFDVSHPL